MARPNRLPIVTGAAAGAGVSAALWLWDVTTMAALSYAGAEASESEAAVRRFAAASIERLELKIVVTQAVLGAAVGLLAAVALSRRGSDGRFARSRVALASALVVLAAHVLSVAGMIGSYPQLFSTSTWPTADLSARVRAWLTHGLGPAPFDGALVTLLVGLTGLALVRAWPQVRRLRPATRGATAAAAAVAVVLIAGGALAAASGRAPRDSRDGRPNLLVIGIDSLRTDRIESPEVMPFTSSLAAQGTLFRFAFTPIARTFPSWVSTLTGLEPRHHGVRHMFPRHEDRRDVGPTFVSELRDAGYRTFVVGNFAADVFPRFEAGFEDVDAPAFTVDTLARASLLAAHHTALPLLRIAALRAWFSESRNLPNLADPQWLADRTVAHVDRVDPRPFAGVVFLDTAHFPYAAPYPYFKWKAGDYRGRYLYDVAPTEVGASVEPRDVEQIRNRYDGAVRAMDDAIARLVAHLRDTGLMERTVVVVMADHGEDLLETPGIAGHGDTLGVAHSQVVPILLVGPGVPRGVRSRRQVRLYDLAPTVLGLLRPQAPPTFGDGLSLFADGPRPICVETGIWFWPDLPAGLRGHRLTYPAVDRLLEVSPESREIVIRRDRMAQVETYKERGLLWGARLWHERATPTGRLAELVAVPGVEDDAAAPGDLREAFEQRCVDGDPRLRRLYDNIAFTR